MEQSHYFLPSVFCFVNNMCWSPKLGGKWQKQSFDKSKKQLKYLLLRTRGATRCLWWRGEESTAGDLCDVPPVSHVQNASFDASWIVGSFVAHGSVDPKPCKQTIHSHDGRPFAWSLRGKLPLFEKRSVVTHTSCWYVCSHQSWNSRSSERRGCSRCRLYTVGLTSHTIGCTGRVSSTIYAEVCDSLVIFKIMLQALFLFCSNHSGKTSHSPSENRTNWFFAFRLVDEEYTFIKTTFFTKIN